MMGGRVNDTTDRSSGLFVDHANGTFKGASTERHQIGLAPWEQKMWRRPLSDVVF